MRSFFTNKYIQAALVFLAIVGAYAVYQTLTYYVTDPVDETTMPMATEDMNAMMSDTTDTEVSTDTGAVLYAPGLDLTGIHIMNNGEVMTGAGVVISDAVIQENGMIVFPDGSTVEPLMDMR